MRWAWFHVTAVAADVRRPGWVHWNSNGSTSSRRQLLCFVRVLKAALACLLCFGVMRSQAAETNVQPHWAFQTLSHSPAPAVKDFSWARTSLDHFILAKLEEHDLQP